MRCLIRDYLSASDNSLQRALKVSYKHSIQTRIKTVRKKDKACRICGQKALKNRHKTCKKSDISDDKFKEIITKNEIAPAGFTVKDRHCLTLGVLDYAALSGAD